MMPCSKIIILITFYFLLHPFNLLKAQWSNNPTQNLQISTFGYDVKACEDGNGGAFIAWDLPHDQPFVWMQWVDRYGYVRWAQPIQVMGQEDNQEVIDIIKSTDNMAILAYMDKRFKYELPPPVPVRIYKDFITLAKIDTTGNFFWNERATVDTTHQGDVVIVPDENGGAYLTFNEIYPLYGDRDSSIVRLQRISNTGQRMWGDSGRYVYKAPQYYYTFPYLNNKFPEGIYLRYSKKNIGQIMESIEPDGYLNWSNVNNWYSNPIPTPDGGAVWAFKYRVPNTGENRIMANRMNSQGNLMWSDSGLVVADNLGYYSGGPEIELLPDTSLVVSYIEDFTIPNFKSRVQIINGNGTFQFQDSSMLITKREGEAALHDIIVSDSNCFILIWRDRTVNPGYYCQKYDKDMINKWDSTDVLYSTRLHENSVYISDNNYGFINIWDEYASLEFGTYAQQISKNGILGEVLVSLSSFNDLIIPEQIKLYPNFPNPFNATTAIPFYIPHKVSIKITIYNVLGQSIKNLFQGVKFTGYHVIHWDGKNNDGADVPSGFYYIELRTKQFNQTKKALLLK